MAKTTAKVEPKAKAKAKPQVGAATAVATTSEAVQAVDAAALVEAFLGEVVARQRHPFKPADFDAGRAILNASPAVWADVLVAAVQKQLAFDHPSTDTAWADDDLIDFTDAGGDTARFTHKRLRSDVVGALIETLAKKAPLTPGHADALLDGMSLGFGLTGKPAAWDVYDSPLPGVIGAVVKALEKHGVGPETAKRLRPLRDFFHEHRFYGGYKRTVANLDALLSGARSNGDAGGGGPTRAPRVLPEPGPPWAALMTSDLLAVPGPAAEDWDALMTHALSLARGQATKTWLGTAAKRLDAVGRDAFAGHAVRWFDKFCDNTGGTPSDRNNDLLRGLVSFAGLLDGAADVCRAVANLAEACCGKADGGGLLASRAGKACFYAIAGMRGLGLEPAAQLERVGQRVKSPWAREEIAKAKALATSRAGVSADEVAEAGVPTYELDASGTSLRKLGAFTATLSLAGGEAELSWADAKGKPLKSVPATVKTTHADALAGLRQTAKAITKTLGAQRDRLDTLMASTRTWPAAPFVERYVAHPLVGAIARRLLWLVDDVPAVFEGNGRAVDVNGKQVKTSASSRVAVWHPVGRPRDEVLAWRQRLEQLGITQPFKQAHREVYLLTDAERQTGVYSNRFAAHVLRQHQLHNLCEARGWSHAYIGSWDSSEGFYARKALPDHRVVAELWLDGAGGGPDDDSVADSGVLLHVATDQVRFYPLDFETARRAGRYNDVTEPLRLDAVPAVAFSEAMRDVDLFVGVASVGNDPTWQDGGPGGAHRAYWQAYSFGDLAATAKVRREVLEGLLPRLTKIRGRVTLDDRFLVVRGDLRTYKIHLGSGNILMEPDSRYLCIVPARGAAAGPAGPDDKLFLPFEGDPLLSIILSKAFLLAEDTKITDPSILSQIKPR